MTDVENLTIHVLREIRDDIRLTNGQLDRLRAELVHTIGETNVRLDEINVRLDHVEVTIVEIAEQQRFVVRYTRSLSEREGRSEREIAELRTRMEIVEARLESPRR